MPSSKILVVGGYGVVGRLVSAHLIEMFPERVVIAGRDVQRAHAACRELGGGSHHRRVDVNDPASFTDALDGVAVVIVCVEQAGLHLLRAVIDRGLAYTDIVPRLAFWRGAEELDSEARRTGARVVLGAGLCPGVSNMMALKLQAVLGEIDRIETSILLSLGDEYGPDSLNHILHAITERFTVLENGRERPTLAFTEPKAVTFPEPHGAVPAYLFPWSDVVYYPKTLGVRSAQGRLALNPPWAGRLASRIVASASASSLKRPGVMKGNRFLIQAIKGWYAHQNDFALVVSAGKPGGELKLALAGRGQAEATAASAAESVRALAEGEVSRAGVWLPEQVMSHDSFFRRLGALGWHTQAYPVP